MNQHYGEILFEDEKIIVVRKRPGVAVESAGSDRDLLAELKSHRLEAGDPPEIFLVHRLDQPVEGLLVVAKTEEAAAVLSEEAQDGRMKKIYLAVISGKMEYPVGKLENYLGKQKAVAYVAPTEQPGTKLAKLTYDTIGEKEGASLLRIRLLTGRFHQIRVQLSHVGHPILGDRKYGNEKDLSNLSFPALCAAELIFLHPDTEDKMHFIIRPENEAFQNFEVLGKA